MILFRQRGVPVPATFTTETTRTIYFAIGIALVSSDLVPLWAGWAMLGSGSLLLTAQLLTGDNIPAMNYIGPVVLGLALLTTT